MLVGASGRSMSFIALVPESPRSPGQSGGPCGPSATCAPCSRGENSVADRSVVPRLHPPALLVGDEQPGTGVGQDLDAGALPGGSLIPPALVDRPRAGPADDGLPCGGVDSDGGRWCGNDRPFTDLYGLASRVEHDGGL